VATVSLPVERPAVAPLVELPERLRAGEAAPEPVAAGAPWPRPRTLRFAVPGAVVAVQAILTLLRAVDVRQGYGARNLEASYHVLLTAKALLRTPFAEHWGLPIVSFGQANDKFIPWGAAVATAHGDYIYTSFPPMGFWLPALVAALRGGEIGLVDLVLVNGLLAAASGVLLYALVLRGVRRMGRSEGTARFAGVAAAAVYLFSAEALQSHGAVYWAQCLLQPLLLAQLLTLDHLLSRTSALSRRTLLVVLGVLTVLACYTEWSAYVFALGVGVAVLVVPVLRRRAAASGLVLLGATAVTGAVLAAHFVLVIGVDGAIAAWEARFVARSGAQATLGELVTGYAVSYGATALAVAAILAMATFRSRAPGRGPDAASIAVVAFSLVAVSENLIVVQHASQYTFDRLKLGVSLALVAGLAVGMLYRRGVVIAGAIVCAAAVGGLAVDHRETGEFAPWAQFDRANLAMVDDARAQIDLSCATVGTTISARGYMGVVLGRAVRESSTVASLSEIAAREHSCGVVLVDAVVVQADMPIFLSVTVVPMDGSA
jgi:hypothetical protein